MQHNNKYDWMDKGAGVFLYGLSYAIINWPIVVALIVSIIAILLLSGMLYLQLAVCVIAFTAAFFYNRTLPTPPTVRVGRQTGEYNQGQGQGGLPGGVEYYPATEPIPDAFDRVIGLEKAKEAARDAINVILSNDEIYEEYKVEAQKGILLYGPPGTGKTQFARSAAQTIGCSFYVVQASSLVGGIVGSTEANIRALFAHARLRVPAIIFFDEIDAIGQKRSGHSINSPSDLALNTLLTQLDGFSGSDGIFVVAATNRADTLDEALTRPGRFDLKIEVGLPTEADREQLFRLFVAGRPNSITDQDYSILASVSKGASPATIKVACDRAALRAAKEVVLITRLALQDALEEIVGRDYTLAGGMTNGRCS